MCCWQVCQRHEPPCRRWFWFHCMPLHSLDCSRKAPGWRWWRWCWYRWRGWCRTATRRQCSGCWICRTLDTSLASPTTCGKIHLTTFTRNCPHDALFQRSLSLSVFSEWQLLSVHSVHALGCIVLSNFSHLPPGAIYSNALKTFAHMLHVLFSSGYNPLLAGWRLTHSSYFVLTMINKIICFSLCVTKMQQILLR